MGGRVGGGSALLLAGLLVLVDVTAPVAVAGTKEDGSSATPGTPTETEVRVTVDWEHRNDLTFEYLLTNWPAPLDYPYDGDFVSASGGCGGPSPPLVIPESLTSYRLKDSPYSLVVTAQGVCSTHDYFEQYAKVEQIGKTVKVWATVEYWDPGGAAPQRVEKLGPIEAPILVQESDHRPYRRKFDAEITLGPARKPDATITLEHWPPTTTMKTTSRPKPGGVPGDLIATVTDAQGRPIEGRDVILYFEPGTNLTKSLRWGSLHPPEGIPGLPSVNWDNVVIGVTDSEGRFAAPNYLSEVMNGQARRAGSPSIFAFVDGLITDGKVEGKVTAVLLDEVDASATGTDRSIVASDTVSLAFTHVAIIREVRSRGAAPAKVSVMTTDLVTGAEKGTKVVGPEDLPYDLVPGDVILLDKNDAIEMEWLSGIKWRVQTRPKVVGDKYGTLTIGFKDAGWYHWIRQKLTSPLTLGLNIAGGVVGHIVAGPKGWAKAVGQVVFTLSWQASAAFNEAVAVQPMSSILFDVAEEMTFYTVEGIARLHNRHGEGPTDVTTGHTMAVAPDGSFGEISEFDAADLDEELTSLLEWAPTEGPDSASGNQTSGMDEEADVATLFEDDFDGENDGWGTLNYGAFANWTVDLGTVDLIGNGLFDFYPDAGLFLDLDGSRNAGGTLISKEAFTLTPGQYRLAFDLAGHPFNGPDTVTVTLGEHFVEDFTMPHDPDMSGFERVVRDIEVATDSEASLSFRQHGGDNVGVLLDEVRLSRLPSDSGDGGDEVGPLPTATPTVAPMPTPKPAPVEPTPTPVPTAASVEPTPSPEPPVQEATRDLWLHEGDIVTRVDHQSGQILGRWDVSHPECPSGHGGQPLIQIDGEAAWLAIADAQWETPVLECMMRLPLDGSSELEAYQVPTGRKPTFIHDAATQGEDLWAITWKKQDSGSTLEFYDDWSLARLDRWTGQLTRVLPRVVALAPTEAGLVVLYSKKGSKAGARRPLRLGIVEPGGKAPREIPIEAALPRTKQGTYVTPRLRLSAGQEGTVALYDEYAGRDIIVFDPASGGVVGQVSPPEGATAIGRVSPVSAGVWLSGLLEGGADFVRYVPFDGWTSLVVDPCTDVAGDCYAQVETASDAGAWVSAWPYDGAFELIVDRVVMRRYDTGGQGLAEVTGEELFGSQ